MAAPAPGRLSITMLCPRRADTCWVTTRASTSTGEPGVYGTITLIGFDGYVWALAAAAQHAIASIAKVLCRTCLAASRILASRILDHVLPGGESRDGIPPRR